MTNEKFALRQAIGSLHLNAPIRAWWVDHGSGCGLGAGATCDCEGEAYFTSANHVVRVGASTDNVELVMKV